MATVLIVDDDLDNLAMMSRLLEIEGFTTLTAKNGGEAILKLGSNIPDVIVLDLAMPILDGWEACRYFKTKFSSQFLPIVIVSGRESPEEIEKTVEHGADDYFFKPLVHRDFVESLRRLLAIQAREDDDDDGGSAAIEALHHEHLAAIYERGNDHFALIKARWLVRLQPEFESVAQLATSWEN